MVHRRWSNRRLRKVLLAAIAGAPRFPGRFPLARYSSDATGIILVSAAGTGAGTGLAATAGFAGGGDSTAGCTTAPASVGGSTAGSCAATTGRGRGIGVRSTRGAGNGAVASGAFAICGPT